MTMTGTALKPQTFAKRTTKRPSWLVRPDSLPAEDQGWQGADRVTTEIGEVKKAACHQNGGHRHGCGWGNGWPQQLGTGLQGRKPHGNGGGCRPEMVHT